MLQFATYYRHIHRLPQRGELKFFYELLTSLVMKIHQEKLASLNYTRNFEKRKYHSKNKFTCSGSKHWHYNYPVPCRCLFFYFNRTPLYEREERISMQQILCFILVYYVISLLVDHDAQNRFSLLCQIFCHFKCSL